MTRPDEPLSPASREDLLTTLSFALTHERPPGKAQAAEVMAKIVAERLVDRPAAAGYVG
jgi:hypothetical protein